MDFKNYDKSVDLEEIKSGVDDVANNSKGDYEEVPKGEYEVEIEKLELGFSKSEKPMLICWFNILEGKYKNSKLFMNQVIQTPFQVHKCNEFLNSLESGLDVKFESYSDYADLTKKIFNAIDGKLEYAVEYGENKGYPTFTITSVFED